MEKKFVAGWNMPGYMPDNQPETFDSFEDAKAYIIESLEHYLDSEWEDLTEDKREFYANEIDRLKEYDKPFNFQAGNYVYWVGVWS